MKHLPFVLILLFCISALAQPPAIEWTQTWSFEDRASVVESFECVRTLDEGGFILAGQSAFGTGGMFAVLFRLDADGNELWMLQYQYGTNANQKILAIQPTMDGGFIGCGKTSNDALLLKVDSDGQLAWNVCNDADSEFRDVQELADGNILVCTRGNAWGSAIVYYLFSADGILLDISPEDGYPGEVVGFDLTRDGGTVFASRTLGYDSGSFVINKTNNLGQSLWTTNLFPGLDHQYSAPYDVKTISSGDYVACGYQEQYYTLRPALGKVGPDGAILWHRNYVVGNDSRLYEFGETGDRGFVAAGTMDGHGSFLLRTAPAGIAMWSELIDDSLSVRSMDIAADGGVILAGHRQNASGYWDMHTIKFVPEVVASLNPSTQTVPATGGTILFDAHITHTLTEDTFADAIQALIHPDGTRHIIASNILRLYPGEDIDIADVQVEIPANAPPGEYLYQVRIGDPAVENPLGYAAFPFEKLAAGALASEETGNSPILVAADNGEMELHASPNPFNPSTTITLTLPQSGDTVVRVLNVLGREVARLHDGALQEGSHRFVLDGSHLSSGVYLVHVTAGTGSAMQKVLLLK